MVTPAADNGQTTANGGPPPAQSRAAALPLSGDELFGALAAAAAHLRDSAPAIDAINVYPVPDGDTGSNMAATLREAVDTAALVPSPRDVSAVLAGFARGALYGARGNSGVILSQALRGLATAADGRETYDAAALAMGLQAAATAAYGAVAKPVEGTMLTVLRAAGEGAAAHAATLPARGAGLPCVPTLARALDAAVAAEAATPTQLPALAEAGVTDAGGEGVCTILRGLIAALTGATPAVPPIPDRPIADLGAHTGEAFGFCTEFVVESGPVPLDVAAIRDWATSAGRSVVVVGSGDAVRVHLHADDADAVLAAAAAFGQLARTKVEDMSAQHVRFRASGSGASRELAVLALSRGDGIDRLFEDIGAAVGDLGEVVKPPAGEIAAAADRLGARDVIVLPNHANVVLAARQAADLTRCTLHVIETRTLPQGIAAAFAFAADRPVAANIAAMTTAAAAVTTVEVTTAAATRVADGVAVREGQAIALVDGRLIAAADAPLAALLAGLDAAGTDDAALVTLFLAAPDDGRGDIEQAIAERFPAIELDIHVGGQPLYAFIASVES